MLDLVISNKFKVPNKSVEQTARRLRVYVKALLSGGLFGLLLTLGVRWRKTMLTQVAFRSNNFPPYDDEEDQINSGLWGKRLAEYLVDKLKQHGIETEEIIAEDWGWYIPIKNEEFRLAICCGHQDGDDDEYLCFTDPATPIIRKFFKKIDATNELKRVVTAMENILSSDPGITDIKWTEVEK